MKALAALIFTALAGCATTEKPSTECTNAAKYAFTMSMLREAGIPYSSISDYTVRSTVVTFPVNTIQAFVLGNKNSPDYNRATVESICHAAGWPRLEAELKSRYSYITAVKEPVSTPRGEIRNRVVVKPLLGPSFRISASTLNNS